MYYLCEYPRKVPIEEIDLQLDESPLPKQVKNFLTEAESRIDKLFDTEKNRKVPRFIPSNAELVYKHLSAIVSGDFCLGNNYCEWGSGYGVGSCLASMLGFNSFGIEIEPSLVTASKALAKKTHIDVTIIESDYMPEGFECYEGSGGAELIRPENYVCGTNEHLDVSYEGMEINLDEVDLFFVYPWPGEQEFMLEFFQAIAADGALFLVYLGDDDFVLYRKTAEPFD
ncbi:MAG: hypothetical protein CMP45_01285 [Rickettsiales bacterium]|nr:hypothetical protein [Verrucomicrobiaceae bacterium]MBV63128.1 hypothetical protein [Rickettsiales bacterium]|tara:strand:+ start:4509 stop:5189 length:681 start_codon:yes stop_codon:yes gene_type:complete